MGAQNSFQQYDVDQRKNLLNFARNAEIRSRSINCFCHSKCQAECNPGIFGKLQNIQYIGGLMKKMRVVHFETYFHCSNHKVLLVSFNGHTMRYETKEFTKGDPELIQAYKNSQLVKDYKIQNNNSIDEVLDYCDALAQKKFSIGTNNCQHSAEELYKQFGKK